jgi:hypothetical protein
VTTTVVLGNNGSSSPSTTIDFPIPAGVADGAILAILILTNSGTATYTVSGGGSTVFTSRSGPDHGSGNAVNTEVWTGTASGAASTTVTVTSSASTRPVGILIAETGVQESGVVIASQLATATQLTSQTFPSVTIPDASGWHLVGLAALRNGSLTGGPVLTAPSGYTVQGESSTAYSNTPNLNTAALDSASTVGSGSQSPGTLTWDTASNVTLYTLGFAPAAVVGTNYVDTADDSVASADTFGVVRAANRTEYDSTAAADSLAVEADRVRAASESTAAADSFLVEKGSSRSVALTDSVGAADSGGANAPASLTTGEVDEVSASDSATLVIYPAVVGQPLTRWSLRADGTLHRWLRDTSAPTAELPGAPISLTVTQSGTTATITWQPPLSDGGSAITDYKVTRVGGPTQTIAAGTLTATFTGLTTGTAYQFSVAAENVAGVGPVSLITTLQSRFPGDTNPKVTGLYYLGIDEADKDPAVKAGNELSAPEPLVGKPPGVMRYYYTTQAQWAATAGSPVIKDVVRAHSRGWIPWISLAIIGPFGSFADAAANGYTLFLNLITYIEDNLTAPVWITLMHEPENQTTDFGGPANSTEQDYGDMNREFRRAMDAYAAAHGGVGVYKWKNVAFAPIFMAETYNTPGSTGPHAIDNYWIHSAYITATAAASNDTFTANTHRLSDGRLVTLTSPPSGLSTGTTYHVVNSTANTFQLATTRGGAPVAVNANGSGITVISHDLWDFMGIDPYVKVSQSSPTAPFKSGLTWCATAPHQYALSTGENGVNNGATNAGQKFTQEWNYITDGTWDFVALLYWNIGGDSLTDNNTGGLLSAYVAAGRQANVVNYWDVPRPDGGSYPKPAGV